MNKVISIKITDVTTKTWEFDGLKELTAFISSEAEYWKKGFDEISDKRGVHPYLAVHKALNQIITTIDSWSPNLKEWDQTTLNQQVKQLQNSYLNNLNSNWLWSGHPYASIFIECHKLYNNLAATSFIELIHNKPISNINNNYGFIGAILAYEFLNQGSDLSKRKNGEKVALGQLRARLDKKTTQLITEVEVFEKKFNDWDKDTKKTWDDWVKSSSNEHTTTQDTFRVEFRDYMDACKIRIDGLEKIYEEKLRLDKPATYWRKSARKYGIQGGLWSLALIALVMVGFVYFSDFFTKWLEAKSLAIQLNTIQGIALFGTVLAIYAFLIKTLSRLTFSSFHLMRDSEEREQLTYLYLSLNNENQIDTSSRDIVLQAIFSRSETGLLASESGPTMPGIGEILKANPRN